MLNKSNPILTCAVLLLCISMLIFSCAKEPASSEQIASEFVGNWRVYESVTKNTGGFSYTDTFLASSVKRNDSVFGVVQSTRIPVPAWVGTGPLSADTLWFQAVTGTDSLWNNAQGDIGTYTPDKNTLSFTYWYGLPSYIYIVDQIWERQ